MSYIAIVILMIFVFLCGYVLVIAYKLYQNEKKLIKYSIEKEVINNILEEINNPQQIITGKEYKIIVTEIDNNR